MDLLLSISLESMTVFQWGAVIGASLVAALGDVRERRIPNALTFPLLIAGLIWAGWFGGWAGLGEAAVACLLLGGPYVLLFVFAGGGAGDAKLMGAIGPWLGLRQSVVVLLCVASAGVVMAVVKAVSQRRLKFVLTNVLISFYTFVVCVAGGRRPKPAEGIKKLSQNTICHSECNEESLSSDDNETLRVAQGDSIEPDNDDRFEVPYGVAICSGVCAAAAVVRMWGVDWLW